MDWFLYDNGFRHERVKISDIDKVIFQTSNYAYNMFIGVETRKNTGSVVVLRIF